MDAQLLQFVSNHGTVVVVAVTLLATIGIVQWRKARVAELDLALMEELLNQGLTAAEIQSLLHAKAASDKGLLKQLSGLFENAFKQYGALSGDAQWTLMMPVLIAVFFALAPLTVLVSERNRTPKPQVIRAHVSQSQANQPPASRDSHSLNFALTPEQPFVFLDEAGTSSCRVYLTGGSAADAWLMAAAISAQDNPDGELLVEAIPVAVLQTAGENGQRYCDVRLQAVRGGGQFTVQVTAVKNDREQAQTTFSVQVGRPQQTAAPADHGGNLQDGWL